MALHLKQSLAAAQQDILRMGELVGQAVHNSVALLESAGSGTLEASIPDEEEINSFDVGIEEACLRMLALHQPVAGDLRRITTILKITLELERIGDLAGNIVERANSLRKHPAMPIPALLVKMAQAAVEMVDRSLAAYATLNLEEARRLCDEDDAIDQMNREIIAELTATMHASPDRIEGAVHLFSASRQVERIADHATTIAENVVYLIEGEIVRHRRAEASKRSSA